MIDDYEFAVGHILTFLPKGTGLFLPLYDVCKPINFFIGPPRSGKSLCHQGLKKNLHDLHTHYAQFEYLQDWKESIPQKFVKDASSRIIHCAKIFFEKSNISDEDLLILNQINIFRNQTWNGEKNAIHLQFFINLPSPNDDQPNESNHFGVDFIPAKLFDSRYRYILNNAVFFFPPHLEDFEITLTK